MPDKASCPPAPSCCLQQARGMRPLVHDTHTQSLPNHRVPNIPFLQHPYQKDHQPRVPPFHIPFQSALRSRPIAEPQRGTSPVIAIAISHIIVPPAVPSHHCVVWRHPASRLYLPDSRVQRGDVGLHGLQGTEPCSRHSGHPSVTSSCRHARNAGLFMPASRATVDDIFSLNLQSSQTRGTPRSHAHCLFTAAFNIRKFGNLLFGAARPARRHT